eukprot:CAMPEP_0176443766 /NCGR_PEP_ID=MMETSP0127-20121128/22634_1 /TAXON_ID=938130 /ORGANISM="Platyophrya macrostoma, Strain WH" /LENGTH=710 /DNA_ID=CAMNT_0017829089 /DNA_START=31 /DNA_END=2164 /DNA_ORIENTATION=-
MIQWFFEADDHSFQAFETKFAEAVERKYVGCFGKSKTNLDYEGWKYELDFDAMTQKNRESGRVRKLRRNGPAAPPVWQWMNDNVSPFTYEHAEALEALYQSASPESPSLETDFGGSSPGGFTYRFDFKAMTQMNTSTNKIRNIQRVATDKHSPAKDFTSEVELPPAKKSKVEAVLPPAATVAGKSAGDADDSAGKSATPSAGHHGGTKLIKKGRGVVDPHSGMADSCHVYESGHMLYQCMLNQTNIGQNNNKFYVVQLLEEDKGGKYYVFTRWGRVGVTGQSALDNYTNLPAAIAQYKKKFREKTMNDWDTAQTNFNKIQGKYQLMQIDLGEDDDAKTVTLGDHMGGKSGASADADTVPSKLSGPVQNLIKTICNTAEMTASMKELEIDTDKMPLGKISKKQIKDAFGHLKEIEMELQKSKPDSSKLLQLSSTFYTLIPHDFGMSTPPVIRSEDMLKRKMDLLDILGDLEIASKLLATAKKSGVNPVDQAYDSLNCDLVALDHNSADFQRIVEYVRNTHGKTHTSYRLAVQEVFTVHRVVEQARYKAYEGLHNKQLLWHGSRTTNFMGILSQGLRIAPPEAPVTGYMFGKGIYFADVCSKSANYCNTNPSNNVGFTLLCEVALGTTKDFTAAQYMDHAQKGSHSTKGVGKMSPDPMGSQVVDGVIWPMGKMIDTLGVQHTSLLYPEYIVYDVAQCRMKYLVQLKFEYGKK